MIPKRYLASPYNYFPIEIHVIQNALHPNGKQNVKKAGTLLPKRATELYFAPERETKQ